MEALISVIIPIYNMEAYLARCLDSVLNNTYRNLEVLCVDDGSKDASAEILRAYAEKDSRIVPIFKENGGVSSARNAGLDRMTGEYVTFVDPDDYVHPQYVELLYRAARAVENGIAVCAFRSVEEKDLPPADHSLPSEPGKPVILDCTRFFQNHNYRSYCWGRLIPQTMVQGLRFREELNFSEDSVFIAELGERNPQMLCAAVEEPLYYYFQRENSLVKQVKLPNRCRVAEIYAQKTLAAENNDRIYLDQAIKRSLSTRYYADHIFPDRQISRKCTGLLRSCLPVLRRTAVYSGKKKAAYTLFILIPGLYWLYRSVTEPDMWAWEKVGRKKRREAKKKVQ